MCIRTDLEKLFDADSVVLSNVMNTRQLSSRTTSKPHSRWVLKRFSAMLVAVY